jgi:hypothetical protein
MNKPQLQKDLSHIRRASFKYQEELDLFISQYGDALAEFFGYVYMDDILSLFPTGFAIEKIRKNTYVGCEFFTYDNLMAKLPD